MTRQLSLALYDWIPANPERNFINCSECRRIVAEDETEGRFCKECLGINEKET